MLDQPAETLAQRVGWKLRRIRIARGLPMRVVGDAIGTTPQTVQRLEMATMTLTVEWVERFCRYYEIPPLDLFDGSPMTTFEGKLQQASARAAIKVICRALNVPCHESLE
jgi:transcriptional regulator with XRE-family HTH domain